MAGINEILDKVFEAFHEKYGENAKIEEGNELVFVLNDCVLIMGLEKGQQNYKFIGPEPLRVDVTTGFYKEEGAV